MIKLFHLFKNYYLGISFVGIIAFAIQEIPYMIMPIIKLKSNPIMNMQNEIPWIEKTQGILGVLSMILCMLIVNDNDKFFSIVTYKEKGFFAITVLMILINFTGCFFLLPWISIWLVDCNKSVCSCPTILFVFWIMERQLFISQYCFGIFYNSYH